ncbi:hypothetical protein M7I_7947 [Glarea lozoyensis 74030]|uniref:Uncharacterized protein n=1 Tax=Glarea lozoyensis (strain ATCC 74030 / MF5533) TaxID=1104152 RepID=H0EYP0_GLAL7|nr:hypothetical protein M7I_7947 [Glarea lozoyensis 74030]
MVHGVKVGTSNVGSERLQRGVECLRQMTTAHGFANIDFEDLEDEDPGCPPTSASTNQFCPSFVGIQVVNSIGKVAPREDPLFWPFPLQGRPLLDVGPKLKSLGFTVLPEFDDSVKGTDDSTVMEGVKTEAAPAEGSPAEESVVENITA